MQATRKRFTAFWSKDFYNAGTRQVSERFFAVTRSYSLVDIQTIASLKVGEKWTSVDFGLAHTVTRIR